MKQALAEFWRFNKREISVAVRRYFMPVRVIAHEMYRIAHEADAERPRRASGGTQRQAVIRRNISRFEEPYRTGNTRIASSP